MAPVTRTLRRSYTTMVASAATTMGIGQMLFLKATYASPPDALGPREGVEAATSSSSSSSSPSPPLPPASDVTTTTTTTTTEPSPSSPPSSSSSSSSSSAAATTTATTTTNTTNTGRPPEAPSASSNTTSNIEATAHSTPSTTTTTNHIRTDTEQTTKNIPIFDGPVVERPLATQNDNNNNATLSATPPTLTPAVAPAALAAVQPTKPRPRILVIGDSLVSGVGGNASWSDGPRDGPPLPKQVARYLSARWNSEVQWKAMSLTGGDVRMLRKKILPMLRRERDRSADDPINNPPPTAVVLVTGVNDWKRMSPRRTASRFRKDLADFITSIRAEVGEDCHVFLPAIPGVHHAPRFHDPLRYFLIFINDYWDSQKLALARAMKNVHFVGQPPEAEWTNRPSQFFCTQDRLHPSELGYQRWGERIANQIAVAVDRGRTTFNSYRHMSDRVTAIGTVTGPVDEEEEEQSHTTKESAANHTVGTLAVETAVATATSSSAIELGSALERNPSLS